MVLLFQGFSLWEFEIPLFTNTAAYFISSAANHIAGTDLTICDMIGQCLASSYIYHTKIQRLYRPAFKQRKKQFTIHSDYHARCGIHIFKGIDLATKLIPLGLGFHNKYSISALGTDYQVIIHVKISQFCFAYYLLNNVHLH